MIDRFLPRTVLFYLPQMKVGGAEISLLRLAKGLHERGVQTAFVTHRADDAARALTGDLELLSLDVDRSLAAWHRLSGLLRQRRPDVLVSALTHSNIIAAVAAKLSGTRTRVVVTEHAPASSMRQLDTSRTYRITLQLVPWIYRLADAIVAVSKGVYKDFLPMLSTSTQRRLTVIPNPVLRANWWIQSQVQINDPWFRAGAPPVILSVGRLSPEKNFSLLIRSFAQLRPQASPPRLAIIGDGPERPALQKLIDRLGLSERVRLLGQCENPFAYMRRAAMFVLASRFEGFGNVLIEAMACGIPVISTDCPVGPHEILEGGRYGTLVATDDADALTEAIEARLRDLRPEPEAVARALEFTAERSVEDYLALFSRVARKAGGYR